MSDTVAPKKVMLLLDEWADLRRRERVVVLKLREYLAADDESQDGDGIRPMRPAGTGSEEQLVVDMVRSAGVPMRVSTIRDQLLADGYAPITDSSIRSYLSKAVQSGALARPERGLYAMPALDGLPNEPD